VNKPEFIPLYDPQTSEKLLISVECGSVSVVTKVLEENGLAEFIEAIGDISEKEEKVIKIK